MEKNVIMEKIEEYILKNVDINTIDADLNIFEEGLVSSLFAIELMTFIEKNFKIKVTMDDLDMDNFNTVNHICDFVMRKTA